INAINKLKNEVVECLITLSTKISKQMAIMKYMTQLMVVLICLIQRTKFLWAIIHLAGALFLMRNDAGRVTELMVATTAVTRVTLAKSTKSPSGLFLYLPISRIYHNIRSTHRLRRPQRNITA
ncbi:hypothetical protein, partial [Pectobacterium parmentieri]|uniref:hypothetical protein n=1 Tax=Pectobacterium parmentieri TaxID=1905730 RepID=UPI003018F047